MENFIYGFTRGLFAALFTGFGLVQIFDRRQITLKGWIKKSENPNRYWVSTISYLIVGGFFLWLVLRD